MRKFAIVSISIVLILFLFVLIFNTKIGDYTGNKILGYVVHTADTEINEYISSDTIWNLSGSPYILQRNVIVEEGVTLTIEPGVVVLFNGNYDLAVDGVLDASGNSTAYITFTSYNSSLGNWGRINFRTLSSNINISYVNISYADYGIYGDELDSCKITYSIFSNNSHDIYLDRIFSISSISNNIFSDGEDSIFLHQESGNSKENITIQNNQFKNYRDMSFELQGSFSSINLVIFKNNFSNCSSAICIHDFRDDAFVSFNKIHNSIYGLKDYNNDDSNIRFNNNLITNTDYCIQVISGWESQRLYYNNDLYCDYGLYFEGPIRVIPKIYHNNIFSETIASNIITRLDSLDTLYISNNFFNETNSTIISDRIYDYYDNYTVKKFIFEPYLNYSNYNALYNVPKLNITIIDNETVNLTWNIEDFDDIVGFKIYYDYDSSLAPYNGNYANEGISPIDVGNVYSYVISGLNTSKVHYFAITAYDSLSKESWFSEPAIKSVFGVDELLFCPQNDGLIGTIPNTYIHDSGNSGTGDSLEVYCRNNTIRLCLSFESCPWRNQIDSMDGATCPESYGDNYMVASANEAGINLQALVGTGDYRINKIYCNSSSGEYSPGWTIKQDEGQQDDDGVVCPIRYSEGITVHSISTSGNGVADNSYMNGWNFSFSISVPTEEEHLTLRFSDWTVGNNRLETNNNTIVVYNGTNYTVGSAIGYSESQKFIIEDENPDCSFIQVSFDVLVKLPEATIADHYSTSYGIRSTIN